MELANSVSEYYSADPAREERLQEILSGRAGFSLREIDWYVTNMSARKPQVFTEPRTQKIVAVNSDYKDALRCYHKQGFDSFKRKSGSSELKQRNFFRWALENGIVDKVAESIEEIKEDIADKKVAAPAKKRQRKHKETVPTFAIIQQTKQVTTFSSSYILGRACTTSTTHLPT